VSTEVDWRTDWNNCVSEPSEGHTFFTVNR
jgi:hypothetical protein